jgi:hypothetical protein
MDCESVHRELLLPAPTKDPPEVAPLVWSTSDPFWLEIHREKDGPLREFHRRVWETCLPHARDVFSYYEPEPWVPHVTLAHGEESNSVPLSADLVQRILGSLNTGVYRWEISIDNITLVWDYGTIQKPARTFPLQGRR